MKIISKDKKIISHLRKNSRYLLKDISLSENIPIPTIFDRMKKLKNNNVVLKYCSLINPEFLRFSLSYIFIVKLNEKFDIDSLFINNVYELSTNKTNNLYFLEVYFKNNFQINTFLKIIRKKGKIILKKEIVSKKISENLCKIV